MIESAHRNAMYVRGGTNYHKTNNTDYNAKNNIMTGFYTNLKTTSDGLLSINDILKNLNKKIYKIRQADIQNISSNIDKEMDIIINSYLKTNQERK
ncbi:MAG: hypothetical protein EP298_01760 [Gammaproteobacteria bacterium]|nr:MAG: hypothetical protein EP298_01760 [Gammaproteobacteria bacterium]UTW41366.1 hypothetical protein KFE69_07530 [bacterium SCSIO 12844]